MKHKHFSLSNKELSILESVASFAKSQSSINSCLDACKRHSGSMESDYSQCLLWAVAICAKTRTLNLHEIEYNFQNCKLDYLSKQYKLILAFHLHEFCLDLINILDEGHVYFYPKVIEQ